jgi:outer membrane protein assembly factor BamB
VAYDAKTGAKKWTSPSNISLTYYSRGSAATYLAAALGSGTLIATANDGLHVFSLTNGHAIWNGTIAGISGVAANPIIVNDPASGTVLYVVDNLGLIALK